MIDILVLCYHAVSDRWPAALSVTPEALDRHLTFLARRGYRGRRFTDSISEPATEPTVAITFDDNYRSVLEIAKPILDRHGFPGTLYVPSDWPEDPRPMRWPGIDIWLGTENEHELHCLQWAELRDLAQAGWEIGSHTCSHPHLTQIPDSDLRRELTDSKAKIEEKIQVPCTSIAYPYGDVDERVEQAAADAGYLGGASIPRVLYPPRAFSWPRTPIFHNDSDLRFRAKVSPRLRKVRRSRLSKYIDRTRIGHESPPT